MKQMDKKPIPISDLLALRDGEPHTADVDAHDPEVAAQLARVRALQGDLQALPDVPMSAAAWQNIATVAASKHAQSSRPPEWLRYPAATAAVVFFASLLGIYVVFGGNAQDSSAPPEPALTHSAPQLQADGLQLASLMSRSRQLEMRLRGQSTLTPAVDGAADSAPGVRGVSPIERRLMGRLADVDAQIATLFESGSYDPQQRQRLWAQRVNLLESLVALCGGQVGDLLEDTRSM